MQTMLHKKTKTSYKGRNEEELKILQKTYDMIQYGYTCLRQFPKSEKYALASEMKAVMARLLRLIGLGRTLVTSVMS